MVVRISLPEEDVELMAQTKALNPYRLHEGVITLSTSTCMDLRLGKLLWAKQRTSGLVSDFGRKLLGPESCQHHRVHTLPAATSHHEGS